MFELDERQSRIEVVRQGGRAIGGGAAAGALVGALVGALAGAFAGGVSWTMWAAGREAYRRYRDVREDDDE